MFKKNVTAEMILSENASENVMPISASKVRGSLEGSETPGVSLSFRSGEAMLERYADHPSAYIALNKDTLHFISEKAPGMIPYRSYKNYLFQFGGVFAPKEAKQTLLAEFLEMARRTGKRVCVLQLRDPDVPIYRQAGFRINQLGTSYTIYLEKFKTAGTRFMKMRNKIRRAIRTGVTIKEVGVETPRDAHTWSELSVLTDSWLKTKGSHAKLLEFMVGELGEPENNSRRVLMAYLDDKLVGFISYVPSYGEFPGYMHDITRRVPDAPPGVMELINMTAIERFKEEGVKYLNLGFTPMAGLSDEMDKIPGRSTFLTGLLRKLARYGNAVYPSVSQVQYKLKWHPSIIKPEYVAFQGRFRLSMMLRVLQVTRSI